MKLFKLFSLIAAHAYCHCFIEAQDEWYRLEDPAAEYNYFYNVTLPTNETLKFSLCEPLEKQTFALVNGKGYYAGAGA